MDELPRYLNGPRLVAWLTSEGIEREHLTDSETRRYYDWERGDRADVYSQIVDRMLTRYGIALVNLPDDIWDVHQRPTIKHLGRKAETRELLAAGIPEIEIAERLGLRPNTVHRHRRAMDKESALDRSVIV
jgi:hypothetical protein